MWREIARDIAAASGVPFTVRERSRVPGGCINEAYRVTDGQRTYFVKTGAPAAAAAYSAEADALAAIAATGTVRVPEPLCAGSNAGAAWLILEYIALSPLSADAARMLGGQLALLHANTGAAYGWRQDNTLGTTPQANGWCADWAEFWRDRRLAPQLALARERGYGGRLQRDGECVLANVHRLLAGHQPAPALLHGDLWSGNAARDVHGVAVIFDPASYYGDREADLAMAELFGGFPPEFHSAYRAASPLHPGYVERRPLYNVYHALNHLNLFGGAYLRQAEAMMARLLASV